MRDEMKGHDLISRREAHMMMMMPTVDAFLPFLDTLFKEKGKIRRICLLFLHLYLKFMAG